jgi:hypothetical protein
MLHPLSKLKNFEITSRSQKMTGALFFHKTNFKNINKTPGVSKNRSKIKNNFCQ